MTSIKTVAGYNLLILVACALLIRLTTTGDELGVLLLSAFAVAVQTVVNLIISVVSFIKGDTVEGKSFLLSTGLVLVIGFSVCWGNASI